MSMTTRIAPIAVAGVAGILVGYLLAPNVGAVREDLAARFNEQTPLLQQLQASVANIEARVGTLPDGAALSASVQEQLSAAEGRLATQTEAIGTQLAEQGGAVPQELTTGLDDIGSRLDSLGQDVASLREEMAAGAQAAQEPAADEAGALAEEIGATGAVLLPGQAALFGGTRIDLSELDLEAGTATLSTGGGEPSSVAAGDTVQLSQSCTVRLAGVAANAAYLAPENCAEGGEAASGPAAGEAPQGTPPAADAAPASDEQANQPPAGGAPAGDQQQGSQVPAQGAQAVPDQQPGQQEQNAPNAGEPQGGQPAPAQ